MINLQLLLEAGKTNNEGGHWKLLDKALIPTLQLEEVPGAKARDLLILTGIDHYIRYLQNQAEEAGESDEGLDKVEQICQLLVVRYTISFAIRQVTYPQSKLTNKRIPPINYAIDSALVAGFQSLMSTNVNNTQTFKDIPLSPILRAALLFQSHLLKAKAEKLGDADEGLAAVDDIYQLAIILSRSFVCI